MVGPLLGPDPLELEHTPPLLDPMELPVPLDPDAPPPLGPLELPLPLDSDAAPPLDPLELLAPLDPEDGPPLELGPEELLPKFDRLDPPLPPPVSSVPIRPPQPIQSVTTPTAMNSDARWRRSRLALAMVVSEYACRPSRRLLNQGLRAGIDSLSVCPPRQHGP